MAVIKYWNGSAWVPASIGPAGPQGPPGTPGDGVEDIWSVTAPVGADGVRWIDPSGTPPVFGGSGGGEVGPMGPEGPAGPAGPAGPEGPAGPPGDDGAAGAAGATGATGATGPTGDPGPVGPPGGSMLSAQWNFNQTTTISPNTGTMRMNATTYAATTLLWIHEVDRDGLDRSAGLNTLLVGNQIIMQSAQGRAVWGVDTITDSGTYRTIGVTMLESSGSRPNASSTTTIYIVTSATPHEIQNEGTTLGARTVMNFIGPAVTASDNSLNARTDVTISTPNILVLGPVESVPGGTPADTVIIRRAV